MADPIGPPIAVARACTAGATHTRLVEIAKGAGGLTVHPYMGIEDVWELAAMLSVDSRAPRARHLATTTRHMDRQRQGAV